MVPAIQPETKAAPDKSGPAQSRRGWVLSLPVVLGLVLLYLLVYLATAGGSAVADPDIWWHLRNASVLMHSGHFIRIEMYTFSVGGKPWINFEWLAELPYFFAYQWLGDRGLFLVMMLAAAGILLGVYWLGRLRSGDWKAAFAASLVALLLMTVSLGPRTLLFGWLFLVLELGLLWSLQQGRDHTAWLPLLFLLWINTHGSWFIGFVLMVVFFACGLVEGEWGNLYATRWTPRQMRKFVLVTVTTCAALFVNPYGWRLVAYPLDVAFGQKATLEYVAEWASLDFHSARGKVLLGMFLLLGALQLVRRRRWSLQDLAFATIAAYGAVTYVRFVFLAAILVAPLLAIDLSGWLTKPEGPMDTAGRRWLRGVAAVALVAGIVSAWPTEKALHAGIARSYAEKAVPYVRSLAGRGPLFNDANWGGYFEWNAPAVPEFVDTRVDIFAHEGVLEDYERAVKGQDTFAVLNKYGIRNVLLARGEKNAAAVNLLTASPEWKRTYDDGQAVGFERVR